MLTLVPLPDGRWLALEPEQLASALAAGAAAMPSATNTASAPATQAEWLTAEQMEVRTQVPASWWLKAARERKVLHQLFGKYVRFNFDDATRSAGLAVKPVSKNAPTFATKTGEPIQTSARSSRDVSKGSPVRTLREEAKQRERNARSNER